MSDRVFNYEGWADVDLDKKPEPPAEKDYDPGFPVILADFINRMASYE